MDSLYIKRYKGKSNNQPSYFVFLITAEFTHEGQKTFPFYELKVKYLLLNTKLNFRLDNRS